MASFNKRVPNKFSRRAFKYLDKGTDGIIDEVGPNEKMDGVEGGRISIPGWHQNP